MTANTCTLCHRPIPLFRDRYLIRDRHTICIGCATLRARLHQLIAPDCQTHHDTHHHADRIVRVCFAASDEALAAVCMSALN